MKKSRRKDSVRTGTVRLTHDCYTIELVRVKGLMERLLNVESDLGWIFCSVTHSPHDWASENLQAFLFSPPKCE